MRRIALFVLLLSALAANSFAQSPSKLLKSASAALGGERALRQIRDMRIEGDITRSSDGAVGRYQLTAARGSLLAEKYDLNGFEWQKGYNGKSGWIRDSRDGLRTLTGDAAKYFQAEANYRDGRWLDAKSEKLKVSAGPSVLINGTAAKGVILTNTKGVQTRLFFDAVSGRLLREEFIAVGGARTIDYADYRTIDGIATPFSITISEPAETLRIAVTDAAYNRQPTAAEFAYPTISDAALPDIPALLEAVRANAAKVNDVLENYSYSQLTIEREPDKTGRLVEKSSEKRILTFYKGRRVNRLVEKNGKPLSQAEMDKEVREATERIRDIDKAKDDGDQRISLSDALKGSLLINPRRERFKERDVVVFDYEPNPQFKPQTRNERLFALCTGTVWVDEATKQVVRLEANLTKSAGNFLAKAKQGASFTLDNELVNNEIWLPSQADVNIQIKILFAGINVNNLIKYGDYQRFKTEVTDVKIESPIP